MDDMYWWQQLLVSSSEIRVSLISLLCVPVHLHLLFLEPCPEASGRGGKSGQDKRIQKVYIG